MPQNVIVGVRGIEQNEIKTQTASVGTICTIGLKLPNDFDVNYLKKGNVLCDPEYSIPLVRRFVAKVVIFDLPQQVVTRGEEVIVHSYTSKSPGRLQRFLAQVDSHTGQVLKQHPKVLKKGNFAHIEIKLDEPLCLELFSNYRMLGRVTLRSGSHTIAAGQIIELLA